VQHARQSRASFKSFAFARDATRAETFDAIARTTTERLIFIRLSSTLESRMLRACVRAVALRVTGFKI
jgi:hypothetical protein